MAVVATGFFDGVHLGHREVITTLVSSARKKGEEALVVTFDAHPRTVLQQDAGRLRLLTTPQERERLLLSLGVDRVETIPFSKQFASMDAESYIRNVLMDKFKATSIILDIAKSNKVAQQADRKPQRLEEKFRLENFDLIVWEYVSAN